MQWRLAEMLSVVDGNRIFKTETLTLSRGLFLRVEMVVDSLVGKTAKLKSSHDVMIVRKPLVVDEVETRFANSW